MRIELIPSFSHSCKLAIAFGAVWHTAGTPPASFGGIATDSRELCPGDLFAALPGSRQNGIDYLAAALSAGATGVLVPHGVSLPPGNYHVFTVPNTEAALLKAGALRRTETKATVVAISGSAGKTTVKEMIAAVLAGGGCVSKSEGNFNSTVGLPLSLLSMPDARNFVVELGINHPGEMAALSAVARPNIALLTNIGSAHVGNFDSPEHLASEKAAIATAMTADDLLLMDEKINRGLFSSFSPRILRVGITKEADIRAILRQTDADGILVDVLTPMGNCKNLHWPLPGSIGVSALALAVGTALSCGLSEDVIKSGLAHASRQLPRMQLHRHGNQLLMDDTYNASPEAMVAALETGYHMAGDRPFIAVLGDMEELGANAPALHQKIGHAAAKAGVTQLYLYGRYCSDMAKGALRGGLAAGAIHSFFRGEEKALATVLSTHTPPHAFLLFKASRKTALDRILKWVLAAPPI